MLGKFNRGALGVVLVADNCVLLLMATTQQKNEQLLRV